MKERKKTLTLYAMSHCPYAAGVMLELQKILGTLQDKKKSVSFDIQYVGAINDDGQLRSMHGPEEIAENKRQLCAAAHYKKKQKYLDYLFCRAGSFIEDSPKPDADWKACATNGIDAQVLERCSTGEEGTRLLKTSFENAESAGIHGSPTWLLNGKFFIGDYTSDNVVREFCYRNSDHRPCRELAKSLPSPPKNNGTRDSELRR